MSSSRKSATVCNNSGNAMSPLARPGVRSSVAIVDMCLIGFMGSSNLALNLTPCMNSSQPERGLLKSANIEAFDGEYFSDEDNRKVLLTPGNFEIGGGFKDDKLKYYNGHIPKDYILKGGDII